MTVPLLPPDQLEQLADLVAERVVEVLDRRDAAKPGRYVDADAIARMLGIGRATVYEHAAEFGAIQLGHGSRPLVRFDVEKVLEAWTPCGTSERSQAPDLPTPVDGGRRRRRRAGHSDGDLLPVRGRSD